MSIEERAREAAMKVVVAQGRSKSMTDDVEIVRQALLTFSKSEAEKARASALEEAAKVCDDRAASHEKSEAHARENIWAGQEARAWAVKDEAKHCADEIRALGSGRGEGGR